MLKPAHFIAVVFLATTLSACFSAKQNITFNTDDTAVMDMTLSFDAAILAMAQSDTGNDACKQSAEALEKFPKDLQVSMSKATSGADIVCTAHMEGSAKSIMAVMDVWNNDEKLDKIRLRQTFEKSGDTYTFSVVMLPVPKKDPKPDNGLVNEKQLERMMMGMLVGRSWSWSITAPKIILTTGALSDDGKTASYELPMVAAIGNLEGDYSFKVVFRTEADGGLFDWLTSMWN